MGRKITILGMGGTAVERRIDIAAHCEGSEIWSLNNAYMVFPSLREQHAFARMYELHRWDYLRAWKPGIMPDGREIDHWRELDLLACDVWTMETLPIVARQHRLPAAEIAAHFGAARGVWYNLGSPSLMLAHAIYEHDTGQTVDEIRSWGIDTEDESHRQQRSSWAWWTSKADDRGIKLTGSALAYHDEYENDEGLRGFRAHVRTLLAQEQPQEK